MAPARRLGVLLPLPLAGAYDYLVPAGMELAPGTFVTVPLGARRAVGVVWGEARGGVEEARLKEVIAPLEAPPMPAAMRRFIDWVAAYTVSPPGAVLRMAMSVPEALEPPKPVTAYALVEGIFGPSPHPGPLPRGEGPVPSPHPEPVEGGEGREGEGKTPADLSTAKDIAGLRLTPARRRVLAALAGGPPRPAAELAREAGVSPSVVPGLARAGALARVALAAEPAPPAPDPARPGPALSPAQARAAGELRAGAARGGFAVTRLDGVTGSGKTEVYFEAIAEALARGRQVLVLLPEIALSPQWFERFRARFGAAPVVWHSDVGRAGRRRAWRWVAEGAARVVVGARSALFLPFPDLGLIVVDEEHDASYKQEEGVVYHARDMAVVRARLADAPAVLVSATPSLESVVNVARGRYARLHLPERHGGAAMPAIRVVDMRAEPPARGRWLSPPLAEALAETVAAGEQAMLFLNRRGYAPLTLCRKCGHRLQCPNCTAWLVEHRLAGRLACHHCGYRLQVPEVCPECGAAEALVACGPGVERVAEEAAALVPGARLAIMTSDTVVGAAAAQELIRAVGEREIDLLIGTQIVAKGHHFPYLTLLGVVDADLGLAGGDLRAAERTYQLLSQVAGRAGREARPGRVLMQTYMPEHSVMRALARGDRDGFLAAEEAARRDHGMPPFGRLAALVVSGRDAAQVDKVARALGRAAPRGPNLQVLGPALAPLATLRGHHRRRLLLKAAREVDVQAALRHWLAQVAPPASVRVKVDVDPYSFL